LLVMIMNSQTSQKAGANVNGSTTNFGPYIIQFPHLVILCGLQLTTQQFQLVRLLLTNHIQLKIHSQTILTTTVMSIQDEIVDLIIAIKNVGGNASSVTAKLRHKYGLATVIDSTANYGTINSLATVSNTSDVFRIKVKPGCPTDTILFFTVYVTSSNGSNEFEFGIKLNSTPLLYTTEVRNISGSLRDAAGIDLM